ncbi:MAG: DNA adenine methylase [Desulfobacteraceae bacterium]|nr:DNA adenine methylase [Desulfobacteraceae bacterium]
MFNLPRKSFLSYLGGKSLLAKKIIPLFPEHHCYCEVFAGAAWLLFKKDESSVEIINDINRDLITLYRVVKHHLEEFIRYFKWMLISRDEFYRIKQEHPDTLTDIQRAVRFYYLLRTGYGGRVNSPAFSISPVRASNLNLLRIEEELSAAHLRLSRVYVENLPYDKLITRHDRPETLFYLDPPYFNCEDYYGKDIFSRDDFSRLRDILQGISGKFILSINDTPEIRDIFSPFRIQAVETSYSVSGKSQKAAELLVMNFEPKTA